MIELFLRALPMLKSALLMTIWLSAVSFLLGSILGLLIAFSRISRFPVLRGFAFCYVSIFRGTPLLVQMLLVYFGLPTIGIALDPVASAITALTLFSASYLSENFRAGILAVDKGQWEAAMSMGMGYWVSMKRIILPQGLVIAIPTVGSRLIALVKDTSLASTVTVVELTRVADQVGAATFRYMEMFLTVGVIYWVINQMLTILQTYLEGRFAGRYL
ncbi:amino acid ABC transporter permease [Allopusillimonas soli]|uniref:Glutamate/aspartate import permease protein GltK n=1 Tax=Allopusillimonas soli TaxID=659016 RepID=A0A853F6N6_9BURK|nr:amino acid ABC transporter permease [Allopusillimonas soli]NYT36234.1 amino acid ABC transporter permease [Allopusillimonas soli]TEA76561.1 amino acid ABC transporter permease [Allopusillimonas soli]